MVRDGNKKLVFSLGYPPQLYDLSLDPNELVNLSGKGDIDEERLTKLAKETWPLDTLLGDVIRSQTERKLIDTALSKGREELWEFTPRPLNETTNYVRRGDAFPTVERRGYLPYKSKQ